MGRLWVSFHYGLTSFLLWCLWTEPSPAVGAGRSHRSLQMARDVKVLLLRIPIKFWSNHAPVELL